VIHLETTTTTPTLSKPKKTMVKVCQSHKQQQNHNEENEDGPGWIYTIIYIYSSIHIDDTDTVGHREYSSLSSGLTWSYSHTLQNHGICGGSTSWYIYKQFPTIYVTVCSAVPNIIYYHKLSYLLFFRLS
jgi:hypothetical protein